MPGCQIIDSLILRQLGSLAFRVELEFFSDKVAKVKIELVLNYRFLVCLSRCLDSEGFKLMHISQPRKHPRLNQGGLHFLVIPWIYKIAS